MWESCLKLDKYQYAKTNSYYAKIVGILGVSTTLLMGYGLWQYLQLNILYLIIFGPIIFIFISNKTFRFLIQLFYHKFDINRHESFVKNFWEKNNEPSVGIFLPWAGEDLEMHETVLKAVSNLDYKNYKVYMLDDVGDEGHKNLAEKYGFIHLSRPNKGEYKKSGNLQYGYDHSEGEFVFILDADFIPTKNSLRDTIPYIASNQSIGILQTPQYFEQTKNVHLRSKIEFGGGNIVEEFYKVILPCRDEFGGAMCVGTSAIYRRSAIEKLDGTPKVHASEDLATGLMITNYGFHVKYLPLIVSMGKSPETFQGYFKQHLRWCSGNLVFARYWPTAHLSLMARLSYLVNPLYYLSEALSVLFTFQFLALLYFHADSLSLIHSLYFLPYLILNKVIMPRSKANKNRLGTRLAAISNSYTYFYTFLNMITRTLPSWHPTGVKFSGIHKDFLNAYNIGTFISSSFIILFIFVLISKPSVFGNFNAYIVLGWGFYTAFWHVLFLSSVSEYIHPFNLLTAKNRPARVYAYTRKHLLIFLFGILIGSALFNGFLSLRMQNTPTKLILAQLSDNFIGKDDQFDTNIVMLKLEDSPVEKNTEVLGTSEVNAPIKLTYTVIENDNLIKLARRAIADYTTQYGLTMSKERLDYVANIMIIKSDYKKLLKEGDLVTFNEIQIVDALKKGMDKNIISSNSAATLN